MYLRGCFGRFMEGQGPLLGSDVATNYLFVELMTVRG